MTNLPLRPHLTRRAASLGGVVPLSDPGWNLGVSGRMDVGEGGLRCRLRDPGLFPSHPSPPKSSAYLRPEPPPTPPSLNLHKLLLVQLSRACALGRVGDGPIAEEAERWGPSNLRVTFPACRWPEGLKRALTGGGGAVRALGAASLALKSVDPPQLKFLFREIDRKENRIALKLS